MRANRSAFCSSMDLERSSFGFTTLSEDFCLDGPLELSAAMRILRRSSSSALRFASASAASWLACAMAISALRRASSSSASAIILFSSSMRRNSFGSSARMMRCASASARSLCLRSFCATLKSAICCARYSSLMAARARALSSSQRCSTSSMCSREGEPHRSDCTLSSDTCRSMALARSYSKSTRESARSTSSALGCPASARNSRSVSSMCAAERSLMAMVTSRLCLRSAASSALRVGSPKS
mmetsp:Transcript_27981/g.82232  ORF Transcript_27981/g.82232 Transcript_27981/m.82232 type:complete len:242 (+) Transcript_27981:303-1028(+)